MTFRLPLLLALLVPLPIYSQSQSACVAAEIMAGQLITKVHPIYPQEAKDERLEGAVMMHAVIGRDGHVQDLSAVSGPAKLRESAMTAVKHWIYTPYVLNGKPIAVDTNIAVNFTFGTYPEGNASSPTAVTREHVIAGQPVSHPKPHYREDEMVSGDSVFRILIGRDGSVQKATILSGPPARREADLQAVKQWKFEPSRLNGEPVEIDTSITLGANFEDQVD